MRGLFLLTLLLTVRLGAAEITTGQVVVTVKPNAQFGVRDQPMFSVPVATELHVTEVRGNWIGGYAWVDGRKQPGWLHRTEVGERASLADEKPSVEALEKLGAKMQPDERGNLQSLSFETGTLRDDDLAHLRGLYNVTALDLTGQAISDEALVNVAACGSLQKLYLARTQISDQGLEKLRGLRNLEVLALPDTQVTGAGLKHFSQLANLRVLNLARCKVGNDDLQWLALCPELEVLTLPFTEVTDTGLQHLQPLTRLRVLNLDGTKVTGSGFDNLYSLSELRMLYIRECLIEPESIDKLDDRLPGLAIYD